MQDRKENPTSGLLIGLCLSAGFLLISFSRLYGDAGSALFGGGVLDATLNQSLWGTKLGDRIGAFALALILLHGLLAVCCWAMAHLSKTAWPTYDASLRSLTCLWCLVSIAWLLVANAQFFPWSSLGEPYSELVRQQLFGVSGFGLLTALFCLGIGATALRALHLQIKTKKRPRNARRALFAAGTAIAVLGSLAITRMPDMPPKIDRPHVILIGLDSLRTDYVRRDATVSLTPAIDEFLDRSTSFQDAITPLARTFPAWVSVISGRHPHTTGALINLLPRDLIDAGKTLPDILRETGYRTVYATDEVRFSNLDESYGFDELIAPPMGSADFLLGFFSDTPLANLIVNTTLGRWLFPFAYANRGAAVTYDPDTFINRLDSDLEFQQPTFLAVHLTLAHWPYTWSSAPPGQVHTHGDTPIMYERSVARLDRQFRDLMRLLRGKGGLDNAIVVVFSDHGESLGEPQSSKWDDTFPIPGSSGTRVFGHGTHVFAEPQYDVVMALRSYGDTPLKVAAGANIDTPVSLEDVTPTIVDALNLENRQAFDGRSLVPDLLSQRSSELGPNQRIRYLETEFNPPGFALGEFAEASALKVAAKSYRIDPRTDRVLIRSEYLGEILKNRQYAAELGGHILASIPANDTDAQYLAYAAPGESEIQWLDSLPDDNADERVVGELWKALIERFEKVRERPVTHPKHDSQTGD